MKTCYSCHHSFDAKDRLHCGLGMSVTTTKPVECPHFEYEPGSDESERLAERCFRGYVGELYE